MSLINYSTAYGIANPNAMAGGGIGQFLNRVSDIGHKIKVASTANRVANILGVAPQLDAATNGAFTRAVQYGMKKGYGRRKRSGKKKGKK